jgi:hypothetical protein
VTVIVGRYVAIEDIIAIKLIERYGSIIWFFTLTERKDYLAIWNAQPAATQAFLQDTVYLSAP